MAKRTKKVTLVRRLRAEVKAWRGLNESATKHGATLYQDVQRGLDEINRLTSIPLFVNEDAGRSMPLVYFSDDNLIDLLHDMEIEGARKESVMKEDGGRETMRRGLPKSYALVVAECNTRGLITRSLVVHHAADEARGTGDGN